jgi:hypothetical protein
MRRIISLITIIGTLAVAGIAAAAPGGAEVVSQNSCEPSWFGTICTTVHATTNMTATPSGKFVYATNGTAERMLTFSWGGSYTSTSAIHLVTVQQNGETRTSSERSSQTTSYRSGTYALDCVGSLSFHYANGSTQSTDYSYVCTTP